MDFGSVILWHKFPYQKDREVKDRWFVYLGKYQYGDSQENLYLFTTTTQQIHYSAGGKRERNLRVAIKAGSYGFDRDCIMDIDMGWEAVPERLVLGNPDISVRSVLPVGLLREVHGLISRSRFIPLKVKLDIHNSYLIAGIEGLKKPR